MAKCERHVPIKFQVLLARVKSIVLVNYCLNNNFFMFNYYLLVFLR